MNETKTPIRCAIYTRKSHEAGLEQNFNSLDAQREACSAYILSQKHEGWEEVPTMYDDGGFSGGNMERPALRKLMADIEMGLVNVVVVYKVDRLTRSLADFAKIVEKFDKQGISFVSITQQFNTTSSMGRLTLNVLLSFAQFEREVTAERIRDKIAASKKKGMWMGGVTPLGYDRDDKKLIINEEEAKKVRFIFDHFLECKNVRKLRAELMQQNIRTKIRTIKDGSIIGGCNFSLGSLYHFIKNPIYAGKIKHEDVLYEGIHEGIITFEKWQQVQGLIASNAIANQYRFMSKEPSLLKGLIFDINDRPFSPKHGTKKNGMRRYRYYVHRDIILGENENLPTFGNLPAQDIEEIVINIIKGILTRPDKLRRLAEDKTHQQHMIEQGTKRKEAIDAMQPEGLHKTISGLVCKVIMEENIVSVHIDRQALKTYLIKNELDTPKGYEKCSDVITIRQRITLRRFKHEMRLIIDNHDGSDVPTPNPSICKALARAFVWNEKLTSGSVTSVKTLCKEENLCERYVKSILPLAWLPAKLVEELLDGQHKEMKLGDLTTNNAF